jgi:hypothetical protein
MYENRKIRPSENILSMRREGIKEKDGGCEFN